MGLVVSSRVFVRDKAAQGIAPTLQTPSSGFLEVIPPFQSVRKLVSRKIHAVAQVQSAEMQLYHRPQKNLQKRVSKINLITSSKVRISKVLLKLVRKRAQSK